MFVCRRNSASLTKRREIHRYCQTRTYIHFLTKKEILCHAYSNELTDISKMQTKQNGMSKVFDSITKKHMTFYSQNILKNLTTYRSPKLLKCFYNLKNNYCTMRNYQFIAVSVEGCMYIYGKEWSMKIFSTCVNSMNNLNKTQRRTIAEPGGTTYARPMPSR